MGIAHCRYPTAGSAASAAESQPFYVNSPFGIVLGHNGNLINTAELQRELFQDDLRHVNTNSDSEVLLNVLAHELTQSARGQRLDPDAIFAAVAGVHRRAPRRLRDRGDDRRLWPAGVSRSTRHPSAGHRQA